MFYKPTMVFPRKKSKKKKNKKRHLQEIHKNLSKKNPILEGKIHL